jgi:hypothetical protein
MHKRYLTLALCCGAVALAGCGSSSSSNSGTGAQVGAASKAVFSTDLNALCQAGNAAAKKGGGNPTKVLAVVEQYLPKFKALSASGSQQAIYSKFVANIQAEANALKSGNVQGFKAINDQNKALAHQLNAPACA